MNFIFSEIFFLPFFKKTPMLCPPKKKSISALINASKQHWTVPTQHPQMPSYFDRDSQLSALSIEKLILTVVVNNPKQVFALGYHIIFNENCSTAICARLETPVNIECIYFHHIVTYCYYTLQVKLNVPYSYVTSTLIYI